MAEESKKEKEEFSVPKDTDSSYKKRKKEEREATNMLYAVSAHKPFYILPISYNSTPSPGSLVNLSSVDYLEAKFQFSFKFNVIDSFFNDQFLMAFAYTNLSFWQVYNKKNSAPFRETNHEPELFVEYHPQSVKQVDEFSYYRMGFVHQSNGQDVPESRTWNRIFAQGFFNFRYLVTSLKVWYRIPENEKNNPLAADGDDNPDINEYLGYFELLLMQKVGKSTFTTMLRNNLKDENRGAIEVGWSFPLNENYKGYIQFFNGYGESLIDYNRPVSRIGAGILMADWL